LNNDGKQKASSGRPFHLLDRSKLPLQIAHKGRQAGLALALEPLGLQDRDDLRIGVVRCCW
jgi:hypothetical protein